MKLEIIKQIFSICKVENTSNINLKSEYCFIGKTEEEISLVCILDDVPNNTIERDDGWKCFKIQGILDFSLIGILSKITTILAENDIGIFAVSTYNTDYIFTKEKNFAKALDVLQKAGYEII